MSRQAPGRVDGVGRRWQRPCRWRRWWSAAPAAAAAAFKLRCAVSALDSAAKTIKIGSAVINYCGIAAADLPTGLADGLKVRVTLQTPQVNGQWVASAVRSGERHIEGHDDSRLLGNVTAFSSPTAFEVNGIAVGASTVRIDNGPVKDGKVVATRVTVLKASDDSVRGVELHGAISDVDATAKTFMLRDLKVSFAGTVTCERGTETQLVVGAKVEANGLLSADRTTLAASLIRFED